jgi:hypothetical protein
LAQTWVRIASSVQSYAASLLEATARLELDARDCRRCPLNVSMAALEKSDFDQCASCRDCTLEAMRTQASFDLCAFFPISRFTDCNGDLAAFPYMQWEETVYGRQKFIVTVLSDRSLVR